MGNHGTTMFDELRGCSITIHWPHSHQFRTPLGSTRGFRDWNICFPLHSGFLRLDMWTVWGTKTKQSFFLATDQPVDKPWTNRGTTSKSHGKTQKSRGKTQKSRGRGDQISQTGICCVFSIDTKNSWIKCTGLLVGSMWDRARNLGNMYVRSCFLFAIILNSEGTPGRHWGKKHIVAYSCTECQFAIQWDRKSSFWRYMPKIPFDVFCY